mmetsp:Transcript_1550/g.3442  ORF Transcript_1550/g.3442 Transcript_1550/m.3442 type:complete len:265 (+) Transcript_1550:705-1499(+)
MDQTGTIAAKCRLRLESPGRRFGRQGVGVIAGRGHAFQSAIWRSSDTSLRREGAHVELSAEYRTHHTARTCEVRRPVCRRSRNGGNPTRSWCCGGSARISGGRGMPNTIRRLQRHAVIHGGRSRSCLRGGRSPASQLVDLSRSVREVGDRSRTPLARRMRRQLLAVQVSAVRRPQVHQENLSMPIAEKQRVLPRRPRSLKLNVRLASALWALEVPPANGQPWPPCERHRRGRSPPSLRRRVHCNAQGLDVRIAEARVRRGTPRG